MKRLSAAQPVERMGKGPRLAGRAWALFLPSWALYAPALFFPLFYDDLLHLALIEGRSPLDLLRPLPGYGYYRPLVLLWPWGVRALFGRYEAPAFHFLSLAVHLLNIALLFRVARQIPCLRPAALAAGLLFGLHPFHPQALLVPAFSLHVWQTAFFLLAVWIYLRPSRPAFARSMALALLFLMALLNHETAVLLGGILAWAAWLAGQRRWDWAPYLAAGGLYAALYRWLPRGEAPAPGLHPTELLERGRFALQALAFPLVPGLYAMGRWGGGDLALGLATAWLAIALTRGWRQGRARALWGGLALFGLGALPAGLLLPTGYFLHGPRLLYLATTGAALLWGAWLSPAPQARRAFRHLQRLALIGALIAAGGMIRRQVDLHARALEPLRALIAAARWTTPRTALLVNFPEWMADRQRVFPVGSEGALIFGSHLLPGMLFLANTPARPQVEMAAIDVPFNRPEGYDFHPAGPPLPPPELARRIARADLVVFTVYAAQGPYTQVLLSDLRAALSDLGIPFAEGPFLARGAAFRCPDRLLVLLEWARRGPIAPDLSAALHGLDAEGRPIVQADGPPWAGSIPFDQIPEGTPLPDLRILPLAPGTSLAAARVALYNWKTGERLPIPLPSGSSAFVTLPLRPCSPRLEQTLAFSTPTR